jgi:fumarate reductase flavoprotein subunit
MSVLPASEASFDVSVPVLVVGAGACGLTAALSAADAGAEVLVMERDPRPSGSTSLSAGLIAAAGTGLQREHGVEDSPAIFAEDILRKTHGEVDRALVQAIAEASGPLVDWLQDRHGLDLHLVQGFLFPGHTRLRMHGPASQTGVDLEAMLLAAAGREGVDVMASASAENLYAEADGRVVAAGIMRPDGQREIIGCGALILACGGYGGDPSLVARHIPEMAEAEYCGHTSNMGDALRWGEALGAQALDLGAYQGHGSVPRPHAAPLTWAVITLGGFQVNTGGRRFADESLGYSEHAEKILAQPGGVAWNIYDARCEKAALPFADYKEMKRLGAIKEAASVEELAAVTGLRLDALRATMEEVARLAAGQGQDAFGRDFTVSPSLVPPYRTAKVTGALFHTQGGLAVDADARVLRPDGSSLPNLFAGGGAARGISGPGAWGYLAGNGLTTATVLGRIAGRSAARLVAGR